MAVEGLTFTKEEGIATITFNRPGKLNAVTEAMRTEVHRIATELRTDDEVKVLVITGAGEAFSVGADTGELTADYSGPIEPHVLKRPFGWWMLPVRYFPKPTIAALPGIVAGTTYGLALSCDFRIASEKARFSMVFIKRGLIPDGGSTYFLPRIVGPAKALELMMLGDIIDAREAERLGIVTKVVPHKELMNETMELARRLARGPSVAIELIKRGVYKSFSNDLEAQLDFETLAQRICFQTEDFQEGIKSFLEKREPEFKGR
ncbi:MAG TPA: enoyl-CoA hydratase [Dehalococcoidia bacterium]|nr:enoyl-CoA hydratase [Dehalococcoidia bacterium]